MNCLVVVDVCCFDLAFLQALMKKLFSYQVGLHEISSSRPFCVVLQVPQIGYRFEKEWMAQYLIHTSRVRVFLFNWDHFVIRSRL